MMAVQEEFEIADHQIESLEVRIDRPNLPYLQAMRDMIKIISDLCPLIIVNESEIGFVTSDNPVTKYNKWFMERNYQPPYGFGHIGFQCFIPLSPRICFCLYDDTVYKKEDWIMGNPEDGFLQKVSSRCVFDCFSIPIFKTNTFFNTVLLPYDEAGPLRESAYKVLTEKKNN